MRRTLAALLIMMLVAGPAAQADDYIRFMRDWMPRAGGTFAGPVEVRDRNDLSAENLTNGALTAGTSWTATGDVALVANAATYTHSAGSGTFFQASADAAIPWAVPGASGWFTATYTVSGVTGSPVCSLSTAFAATAQTLVSAAGTYSVTFQAKSGTVGNYTVSCTSGAAATITFDDMVLKQVFGDLTVQGQLLVGRGTTTVPGLASVSDPTTGLSWNPSSNAQLAFLGNGAIKWYMNGASLIPWVSDAGSLGSTATAWQHVYTTRGPQGCNTKALTAASPTTFVTVAVPQTDLVNFASGNVIWNVRFSDATDIQTLQGTSAFNCVNKAGTETCAVIVTALNTAVAASAGAAKDDLACTITAVTGLTDVIGLAANCASTEMTETSLQICYRLDLPRVNTVTPQ